MRIIYVLLVVACFTGCTPKNSFKITGKFGKPDATPVKLYLLTENESLLVDSCHVNGKSFELEGAIEFTGIYLLKFFNDQSIYLVLHPNDKITVEIDNTTDIITYYVDKSPDSKLIKDITDQQNRVLQTIDQLSVQWEMAKGDTSILKKVDSTYQAILLQHREKTRGFIYQNPGSLANILALYQNFGRKAQPLFDPYDDHDLFNFVDSNLIKNYPNTYAVKALNAEVVDIKNQIAQNKYLNKIVEEGRPLPPFKYQTVYSDSIILTYPTPKPVVLLFWSTWNEYAAKQLLELNRFIIQNRLQKTVHVIGVALDTSHEKLNTFISENSIILPIVCDYRYWDSEIPGRYGVKRIPSTIITNKKGIIAGQDLFDAELQTFIKSMIQ